MCKRGLTLFTHFCYTRTVSVQGEVELLTGGNGGAPRSPRPAQAVDLVKFQDQRSKSGWKNRHAGQLRAIGFASCGTWDYGGRRYWLAVVLVSGVLAIPFSPQTCGLFFCPRVERKGMLYELGKRRSGSVVDVRKVGWAVVFTGIVEELGSVRRVLPGSRAGKIVIAAKTVLEGTRIGDSIAVNGVCLTVVELGKDEFAADVMPETLRKSGLGQLKAGDPVDLERAMPADGRFGGHIVSGHIDGVGRIKEVRAEQNARVVTIEAPRNIMALVVPKGSIAIDGISLTVAGVGPTTFSVSIIPHTAASTVLASKRAGDVVNLENDIVGKYVQKLLSPDVGSVNAADAGGITLEYLQANGF